MKRELITTSDMRKLTGESHANIQAMAWTAKGFPAVIMRAGTTRLYDRAEFVRWYAVRKKRVAKWHAKRRKRR